MVSFSVDKPEKRTKTVLALTLAQLMRQPAIFAILILIFVQKACFDQIIQLIMKIIHDVTGTIYSCVTNLKYNQCLQCFTKNYDSTIIYSVQHPIANEEYIELFFIMRPCSLTQKYHK